MLCIVQCFWLYWFCFLLLLGNIWSKSDDQNLYFVLNFLDISWVFFEFTAKSGTQFYMRSVDFYLLYIFIYIFKNYILSFSLPKFLFLDRIKFSYKGKVGLFNWKLKTYGSKGFMSHSLRLLENMKIVKNNELIQFSIIRQISHYSIIIDNIYIPIRVC